MIARTPMSRHSATPRCKHCKERFTPSRAGQVIHEGCAEAWTLSIIAKRNAKDEAAKKRAAKEERAQTRARKEKIKTLPDLKREAQQAFNAYIRERDRQAGHPCISSGRPLDWSGNGVDAGHYRSVGAAPHLRYDERNCHAQSKQDNRYGAGRAVEYRIGLIARIGLAEVERLEADNAVKKWTREELVAIKEKYRALARELKKESSNV